MKIDSYRNPRIQNLLLLQKKHRERSRQGLFVVEGVKEVMMALNAGYSMHEIYFCRDFLEEGVFEKIRGLTKSDARFFEVGSALYNRISYRSGLYGLIAVCHTGKHHLPDQLDSPEPLILVVEDLEKPGNLGAVIRTADAARIDLLIICNPNTDLYNPNAIRNSVGCIFSVPIAVCSSDEAFQWLLEKGIAIMSMALTASRYYHEQEMLGPVAIVLGTEASGLTEIWLKPPAVQIKIPMSGVYDSLNVSASAAIAVFEAKRQRGFPDL